MWPLRERNYDHWSVGHSGGRYFPINYPLNLSLILPRLRPTRFTAMDEVGLPSSDVVCSMY